MAAHYVQAVYIYPGAADEAMLSILADAEVNIISRGVAFPSASSTWVVSLAAGPLALTQSQRQGLMDASIVSSQSHSVHTYSSAVALPWQTAFSRASFI